MRDAPRVTVLMSVHDGAATLARALRSVSRQTFGDLEILVIDDGSTDGTAAVLAKCADPRLRTIRQERTGLTRALARGMAEARGELVARLDADDEAMPERLARQVALFDADPRLAAVGSWAHIVDERGRVLELARPPADDSAIKAQLLWDNAFFHSALTLRRVAVLAAGGYDPAVARAQDYDLVWRLSHHGSLANVAAPLLRWTRARGAISTVHRGEQRASAGRTAHRALVAALGAIPEERFWRVRAVWDGTADRLARGDGAWLATVVARLPAAAGRTLWVDLISAVAAAAPGEALALLGAAWRSLPEARRRLIAPDRVARILGGPAGLRATRWVRRRVRGY